MNYLSNICYQVDSRNQSSAKVKRNTNSISYFNGPPQPRSLSRTKKSAELKIKSVSRSFSRRKHQTDKLVTAESGSHNSSYLGFNPKIQKNIGLGALYHKIKNKDSSYFGLKSAGRKTPAEKNMDTEFLKEADNKKEILILTSVYNKKDFPALISTACAIVRENRQILDDPNIRFLIAMSYYKMDQYDLAKLHFEELLKLKEKYKKSVYVFLAICLNNLKLCKEAEVVLEKACFLYPKFYEAKVK